MTGAFDNRDNYNGEKAHREQRYYALSFRIFFFLFQLENNNKEEEWLDVLILMCRVERVS